MTLAFSAVNVVSTRVLSENVNKRICTKNEKINGTIQSIIIFFAFSGPKEKEHSKCRKRQKNNMAIFKKKLLVCLTEKPSKNRKKMYL